MSTDAEWRGGVDRFIDRAERHMDRVDKHMERMEELLQSMGTRLSACETDIVWTRRILAGLFTLQVATIAAVLRADLFG